MTPCIFISCLKQLKMVQKDPVCVNFVYLYFFLGLQDSGFYLFLNIPFVLVMFDVLMRVSSFSTAFICTF